MPRKFRYTVPVVASLLVGGIGYVLLESSRAASYAINSEAESAQVASNASYVEDAGASKQRAVRFGGTNYTNPPRESVPPSYLDQRAWMHGLDLVKHNGKDMLIFSANNYPPTYPTNEWYHDIFYSYINPSNPSATFAPKNLVSDPVAQEPASAAVNSNGRLVITAEDAQFSDWLDQTFGMWSNTLGVIKDYGVKLQPPQGGHSGHVAASGDKFLVSFTDGWITGGGVDNLGSGDDVFGRIIYNDGSIGNLLNTSVNSSMDRRDWWPIVAGSDSNWIQVYQRHTTAGTGGGPVLGRTVSHTGAFGPEFTIYTNTKYYYYDIQYIPALERYLVVGAQNKATNNGVAVLLDKNGTVVHTKTGLPNTVRESQTVVSDDGRTGVYTAEGIGAAVIDITATSVTLRKTVPLDWEWGYMSTDGVFVNSNRVLFATGTQRGIRFLTVNF